jgi:hypothetical protein
MKKPGIPPAENETRNTIRNSFVIQLDLALAGGTFPKTVIKSSPCLQNP